VAEFPHAKVVNDQQWDGAEFAEIVFARARKRRFTEFFQQGVRFAVDDTVSLLNRGATDGLGEMTFARARWPERKLPRSIDSRR